MKDTELSALAAGQCERARKLLAQCRIVEIWEMLGVKVEIVGSLRNGLMMKHRDIDLHLYSRHPSPSEGLSALRTLAENHPVRRIEYTNLLNTPERCLEYHILVPDAEGFEWQIDMIHIVSGSRYDGHFERVADRIAERFTPEMKRAVLRLKYETPDSESIPGVEYYHAVQAGGVRTFAEFTEFRKHHPAAELLDWMPA